MRVFYHRASHPEFAIGCPLVSPDDRRREPRKQPGDGAGRGGPRSQGAARGRRTSRGDRSTRKRVPPGIRIGVAVEPPEVADRAAQFRVLEVDAGLEVITDRLVAPWVDRTPAGFTVDVRAHRLLTHHAAPIESIGPDVRDLLPPAIRSQRQVYADDVPARALERAHDRLLTSVRPLHEFGKLGALVFPFPSSFVPGTKAFDYLAWLRDRAADLPIAVELRHRDWVDTKQREATLAFLGEHRLSYVCVDVPPGFPTSLPPLAVATTDAAFVRFHGRNADVWERGVDTGDDRFAYDYRRGDLEPWEARLTKLAAAATSVHAVFTTGRAESAARDARLLVRVLTEDPEPERPPPAKPRGRRPPPRR
jgi:uncharacterized protein YecE (DUF72 family)